MHVILATGDKTHWAAIAQGIEPSGADIDWATSGQAVLEIIAANPIDLVVADEDLGDMPGFALVKQLVRTNPLINCALVSSLTPGEYHEASEGLGILMQLPPDPSIAEGQQLMARMNQILGISVTNG